MTKEIKSEIQYKLSEPFEYHFQGEVREASTLIIKAPNNKVEYQLDIIDEELSKPVREFLTNPNKQQNNKDDKDEKSEKSSAKQLLSVVKALNDGGIRKIKNAFKDILCTNLGDKKGMCMVDGVERMTVPIYENMSYSDTNDLLEEYIENFIIASRET